MKHLSIIIYILLNVMFCAALLWFFTQNAYLRPYLGSPAKEFVSGSLLLASLYANYFFLYPKLYRDHAIWYWICVTLIPLAISCVELAVGASFIKECTVTLIEKRGVFRYFSKLLLFVFGRNTAFNFIPFAIRNIQQLQEEANIRTQVVCQQIRMLDVCDSKKNFLLISIDNIYYCRRDGNYIRIFLVDSDGTYVTRYGSLKFMEQLLGHKDFIRISSSILVPFLYIKSYDENRVVMKTINWTKEPLVFKIGTKRKEQIVEELATHFQSDHAKIASESPILKSVENQNKQTYYHPSQDKIAGVFQYIKEHPGCRSTEIVANVGYKLSTTERCLSELRKKGLVEYVGSKKTGGYQAKTTNNEP
jgi:hypothetical protein